MSFTVQSIDGSQRTWYVQQAKPKDIHEVKSLRADGHELLLIHQRFENVPFSHGTCKWNGEMAQFIFDNLT